MHGLKEVIVVLVMKELATAWLHEEQRQAGKVQHSTVVEFAADNDKPVKRWTCEKKRIAQCARCLLEELPWKEQSQGLCPERKPLGMTARPGLSYSTGIHIVWNWILAECDKAAECDRVSFTKKRTAALVMGSDLFAARVLSSFFFCYASLRSISCNDVLALAAGCTMFDGGERDGANLCPTRMAVGPVLACCLATDCLLLPWNVSQGSSSSSSSSDRDTQMARVSNDNGGISCASVRTSARSKS